MNLENREDRQKELKSIKRVMPTASHGKYRTFSPEIKERITNLYKASVGKIGEVAILEKVLDIKNFNISRWSRGRNKSTKVTETKSLKTRSSSGKSPKIIGTNLSSMLGNIDKDDILQQMQMVEILDEAGYDENKLIEKLDIAAPSMDEWKQIKNALKLVEENFDIEVKPKTKG